MKSCGFSGSYMVNLFLDNQSRKSQPLFAKKQFRHVTHCKTTTLLSFRAAGTWTYQTMCPWVQTSKRLPTPPTQEQDCHSENRGHFACICGRLSHLLVISLSNNFVSLWGCSESLFGHFASVCSCFKSPFGNFMSLQLS